MRMSELLNEVRNFELDEGFSPKEIKMAIGIASDPRYAKGNMTGAVTAIERMKKGLSKHPQVMAVLKRQNEDVDLDEAKMTTDITNDKKIFKDIEKMGVKVNNIKPSSGNEKNVATITMVGTKNSINKVVDKYQMKHMMGVQDFDEEVEIDEANMNKKQMMDMITKDAKSGLGKIVHKVVDSGNRFEIQVHQDDERDAQKAMKMNPLYIAGKLRVVPALGESKVIPESNDLISQAAQHISHMQMSEKVDSADVDDDASQKDVDDAGKNIIMQLRKSVSMRGNKDVEFSSDKQKVDMKIAQKALDMYNKMKPQDKTKFQTTIAKSYKDLLNAIKGK